MEGSSKNHHEVIEPKIIHVVIMDGVAASTARSALHIVWPGEQSEHAWTTHQINGIGLQVLYDFVFSSEKR